VRYVDFVVAPTSIFFWIRSFLGLQRPLIFPIFFIAQSKKNQSKRTRDLLPRWLFHGFAKGALPEEYLSHNFDEHCLEDTRLIWCLSYPGALLLLAGQN